MIRITSPQQARELPLADSVLDRLQLELVEIPFSNTTEAIEFWQQQGTSLCLLEHQDDVGRLLAEIPQPHMVLEYPEHVISLDGDWHLALTITSDSGNGIYLLFPSGIDTRLDRLIQQI